MMKNMKRKDVREAATKYFFFSFFVGLAFFIINTPLASASLTFTSSGITSNGSFILDSSSTISIGTSSATGVLSGSASGTQSLYGTLSVLGTMSASGTGQINASALQGVSLSTSTPSSNQCLIYNGSAWAGGTCASGSSSSSVSVNGTAVSSPNFQNGTGLTYSVSSSNITTTCNIASNSLTGCIGTAVAVSGGGVGEALISNASGPMSVGSQPFEFTETSKPAAPASGTLAIYAKSGDQFGQENSGGTESCFSASGGGASPATSSTLGSIELAGDIGGNATSVTVTGLYGFALASSTPANNDCLVFSSSTWQSASCSAGASTVWSSLTNPITSLALSMGNNATTFTWGSATGAGTNMFSLSDSAGNTGTGALLAVTVTSSSVAEPLLVAYGNSTSSLSSWGGSQDAIQINNVASSTNMSSIDFTDNGTHKAGIRVNSSGNMYIDSGELILTAGGSNPYITGQYGILDFAGNIFFPNQNSHIDTSNAGINSDLAGSLTVSSTATSSLSQTFSGAYTHLPSCVASPTSNPGTTWWVTVTTSTIAIEASGTPTANTQFNYICFGNPN